MASLSTFWMAARVSFSLCVCLVCVCVRVCVCGFTSLPVPSSTSLSLKQWVSHPQSAFHYFYYHSSPPNRLLGFFRLFICFFRPLWRFMLVTFMCFYVPFLAWTRVCVCVCVRVCELKKKSLKTSRFFSFLLLTNDVTSRFFLFSPFFLFLFIRY